MNPLPAPMLAAADDSVFSFLHTMRGPQFLWLFAGWFVLTFGTALFLRWRGHDTPLTTVVGVLCYEVFGVAHGMMKWEFLILMMILGLFAFLVRVNNSGSSGDSGGSWWSSCSSGGGGCGGGGCGGGCGGCGG